MANLTHWNPFKTLARFEDAVSFNDLFRGLRPAWRDLEAAPQIRIDVSEDDKAFTVRAEIPGAERNDIDVSVEGNQISISAEIKRESSKRNDDKEIHTERYFGKVYRCFALPADLDSAQSAARYGSGVLTLTLPKKSNGDGTKKIPVS